MTEIFKNPNEEEQKQEISIKEFMKNQKQLMENMQLITCYWNVNDTVQWVL